MKRVMISKYNFEVQYSNYMIVFNSVTGTYALFELNDYEEFKKDPNEYLAKEKDTEKARSLYDGGFVITDPQAELHRVKDDYYKKIYNTSVYNATIIPTNACNLACSYCFAPRSAESMTAQTTQKVIAYFEQTFKKAGHTLKHFNTMWFGGEPLLCIRPIEEISTRLIELCNCANAEYHASIHTNLTLLNEDIYNTLLKSRISTIYTTMDGLGSINDLRRPAKNGKPYFDILLQNIERVREFAQVKILVNVDTRNCEQIYELIDYLLQRRIVDGNNVELGFNLINDNEHICDKSILMQYNSKVTEQKFDSYIRRLGQCGTVSLPSEAMRCFALAHNTVVIDPDGNLKKCGLGRPYGSLYDNFITQYDELYFSQTHNPFEKNDCVNCQVFPVCYGGCTHNNMEICTIKHLLSTRIKRYMEHEFGVQGGMCLP